MDEMNQLPLWSKLFRYFIHGVAFSILFLILAFIWVIIFAFLVGIGSILGFIVGFIVLFFFIGGLNTVLTRWIWSTNIRSNWLSLFIHGLGLFFALLIAALPMFFLSVFFLAETPNSIPFSIVLFVPYGLIDGFVAKNIAFALREDTATPYSKTNMPSERGTDQDIEFEQGTTKESSMEDEAAEALRRYNKLLSKYVNHWGYQTGTRILNDEMAAHTRHGDSFAEAVRKIYERQSDS